MSYCLITGATGGLGRAFCFALAEEGQPLFLTGRSAEKLQALKEELCAAHPALECAWFPCNLESDESRAALTEALSPFRFHGVVHVAGADIQKPFSEYTAEKLLFQIRVNFEAAAFLTRFLFDRRAETFSVLVVSSVSGIYPMPYFALYSATKGALTSFFSALSYEWNGIASVTVVLPGAMPTREDIRENIQTQGLWGKLAVKSPDWVARRALRALRRGRRTYIPGFWNNVMNVATKLLPLPWKMRYIARRWSKTRKDAF